jgi:hypothetical protein
MGFLLKLAAGALGASPAVLGAALMAGAAVLALGLAVNQWIENPLVRREAARAARAELLARLDLAGEQARRRSAEFLLQLQRAEMEALEAARAADRQALARFEQERLKAEGLRDELEARIRLLAAERVAGSAGDDPRDLPLGNFVDQLRNR